MSAADFKLLTFSSDTKPGLEFDCTKKNLASRFHMTIKHFESLEPVGLCVL